jgi:branched-subunit amino acid aminotransferase/4-amino-4-deoxychorismate lyase
LELGAEESVRLPTEEDLALLLDAGGWLGSARLRVVAWRTGGATWSIEASATPHVDIGATLEPARLTIDRWLAPPPLTGHKTLSRLPWDLAREKAVQSGYDDALVVDSANNVLETSTANIWVVHGNAVKTPHAPTQCLPGVMRGWLLEHLDAAGLEPKVCTLSTANLAVADEIWISNALIGVRRVCGLDAQRWDAWPRFESLTNLGVPAPGWRFAGFHENGADGLR